MSLNPNDTVTAARLSTVLERIASELLDCADRDQESDVMERMYRAIIYRNIATIIRRAKP